jgi:hypothetical protein
VWHASVASRVPCAVSGVTFLLELKRHVHLDSETMSVAMKQLTESLSSKEDMWQEVLEDEARQRELVRSPD